MKKPNIKIIIIYVISIVAKVNGNEPLLNRSCWRFENSLSGETIKILINNHKPSKKDSKGKIF